MFTENVAWLNTVVVLKLQKPGIFNVAHVFFFYSFQHYLSSTVTDISSVAAVKCSWESSMLLNCRDNKMLQFIQVELFVVPRASAKGSL